MRLGRRWRAPFAAFASQCRVRAGFLYESCGSYAARAPIACHRIRGHGTMPRSRAVDAWESKGGAS